VDLTETFSAMPNVALRRREACLPGAFAGLVRRGPRGRAPVLRPVGSGWDDIKKDLKPIYAAPSQDAVNAALDNLEEKLGGKYQAVIRLWRNAWEEFIPLLAYDPEIRKVICSTNTIESLNARHRRAVRAPGHFPTSKPR
jgi:hypothetical protein